MQGKAEGCSWSQHIGSGPRLHSERNCANHRPVHRVHGERCRRCASHDRATNSRQHQGPFLAVTANHCSCPSDCDGWKVESNDTDASISPGALADGAANGAGDSDADGIASACQGLQVEDDGSDGSGDAANGTGDADVDGCKVEGDWAGPLDKTPTLVLCLVDKRPSAEEVAVAAAAAEAAAAQQRRLPSRPTLLYTNQPSHIWEFVPQRYPNLSLIILNYPTLSVIAKIFLGY